MQHCGSIPPSALVRATLVVLLGGAVACQPAGRLTIVVDSTGLTPGLEAVVIPVDPVPLLVADSAPLSAAQADSLALLQTLHDSSMALDRRFQRLRDALNAEAEEMARQDRRSSDYSRRYAQFQPRSDSAVALRGSRDEYRRRSAELRAKLIHLLPDSARILSEARDNRRRLDRTSDGARRARSLSLDSSTAYLELAPGDWWVGLAAAGELPASFRRISVEESSSDTLRFRCHSTRPVC